MSDTAEITRKVEFDAGHRIPDHRSKCKNAHGHRYVLEATVIGPVVAKPGAADNGMVVDFGVLKQVMTDVVAEPWDHAFLVYEHDFPMMSALKQLEDHKTVVLHVVPTAENLAREAYRLIAGALAKQDTGLRLKKVRLFETPNCYADYPVT